MTPNLYDLLDVEESATPEQIRAAWKDAIADLDPTDRRFRVYNDAAAVLLDPQRRSAYDAELTAARADATAEPATVEPATAEGDAADAVEADADAAPATASGAAAEGGAAPASGATAARAAAADRPSSRLAGAGPGNAALVAAAVAALLSLALMLWVLNLPGARAETSPQERAEERAAYAETATSVEEAAAEIARTVLSYDYRTLDEDLARAQAVMTEDRAEQFGALFEDIRRENVRQKAVVAAAVYDTGVIRIAEDGEQAEVLVFVDQDTKKAGADPFTLRSAVTMTLVRDGDRWLLDDLCTTECD